MTQRFRQVGLQTLVHPIRSPFAYSAHVRLRARTLANFGAFLLSDALRLRRLVEDLSPDIVHLNTSVLVPAALASRLAGTRLVWHVREVMGPSRSVAAFHRRVILGLADRVIVTSNFVASSLGPSPSISVIPNAVDFAAFHPRHQVERSRIRAELGIPEDSFAVALLGSVQREKGYFLLPEVARRWPADRPPLCFVIVAGGVPPDYARSWKGRVKTLLGRPFGLYEELSERASALQSAATFAFTGFRWDVPRILGAVDALAFPVLRPEGFGRPLIEAMASALPVVASDLGPTAEIVSGDRCGLLVPPGDIEALLMALHRLAGDPDLRRRMGEEARREAVRRFGQPRQTRLVAAVYADLAGTPPRATP